MRAKFLRDDQPFDEVLNLSNQWNEKSLSFRPKDIESTYDSDWMMFLYDDNNEIIIDASFFLPKDKAYMILSRIHYGMKYKTDDKEKRKAMKYLIQYFFSPLNLKYKIAVVFLDRVGSNIDDMIAEETGFCNIGPYDVSLNCLGNIVGVVNTHFEELIPDSLDINCIDEILKQYKEFMKCRNNWLKYRRETLLPEAEDYLKEFEKNSKQFGGYKELITAKKIEIEHYKAILGEENNILDRQS